MLTCFWKIQNGLGAVFNFVEEGRTESWALKVVEKSGVDQFASGQTMKGDTLHSFQLGLHIAENFVSRALGSRMRGHVCVSPLCFVCPKAGVFLDGEIFKTLDKFAG